MKLLILVGLVACAGYASACTETLTAGSHAPPAGYCAGAVIFEETFGSLDESKWRHAVTLAGGGNWEFQWYVNDRFNSYTAGGFYHIRPSFTSDIFGEGFLSTGRVIIPPGECTLADWYGCDRQGTPDNIINPIRSSRIDTFNSFHFRFGIVEIRAKAPRGDWLWPALWMMPRWDFYGGWPTSGEIDIMEARGNPSLFSGGTHVGVQQAGHTLHFGPRFDINGWATSHATRNQVPGYNEAFHTYRCEWRSTGFVFTIDGNVVLTIPVGAGFWARGGFAGTGFPNPWAAGTLMAPFDHPFYIIMNLAVGGVTGYFSDSHVNNNGPKPWLNTSGRAAADFWAGRSNWEPTWNFHNEDRHFQVDYVRVWAV